MIVSDNRILSIVPPWQPRYVWPVSEPDDNLDYSLDISAVLADAEDTVDYATASVAPSGDGELAANEITYADGVVTVWLANGVVGRLYSVNVKVYCVSGREFSFFIDLPISANTLVIPPGPPPSPYYSTPIST